MKRIILCFAFALTACASTGVRLTDQQVASLKPGETTEAQVLQAFGQPTTRTRTTEGTITLLYIHASYRTRPVTFIPIVGLFAGGADTSSTSVTLTFDKEGKLLTTTSTSTGMGTSTGLGAGASAPPIEKTKDQPRVAQDQKPL